MELGKITAAQPPTFKSCFMRSTKRLIDSKIDISHTSPRIKNLIQSWQGFTKFLWAKDSIYGIDLDNRLVKTAKVSAFFNGDGEANIVWANGLDSFIKSEVFRGKLVGASGQDNGKFDILISNPPYSVDSFKSTIKYGEESFELIFGQEMAASTGIVNYSRQRFFLPAINTFLYKLS